VLRPSQIPQIALDAGPEVGLDRLIAWCKPCDRPSARAWFAEVLAARPVHPITLRMMEGPWAGMLMRLQPDPITPHAVDAAPRPVHGRAINFLGQLNALRSALGFIDHPHIGTWMLDCPSGALDVDAAWGALLGLRQTEGFTHEDWVALTDPEDVAAFATPEVVERLEAGEVVQFVSRSRHAAGHWVWLLTCCRGAYWAEDGRLLRVIGYDIDITEHRALLARTEDQRLIMQEILDVMPTGQLVVDAEGRITFCNPEAAELIGAMPDHLIGRRALEALPLEEGAEALHRAMEQGQPQRNIALRLRPTMARGLEEAVRYYLGSQAAPPATWRSVLAHVTPVAALGKIFLSFTDMTEHEKARRDLEQAVEQARYIATHDLMTGLPDRFDFLRRLGEAMAAPERPLAVMMIDLDDFKSINDGMGHEAGDQLLKTAALRLQRGLPEKVRLARFGGDEFVLMLPDCCAEEAMLLAEDLAQRFAAPLDLARPHSQISCSIGFALAPRDGETPEALMRAADLALYEAKAAGRGQIHRFSPALARAHDRRSAVRRALQRALAGGHFRLVLQPQFDLTALDQPIGAEVLLRLTDPDLGPISPAEFIPVAETQDLIAAIDREVVAMVGRLREAWWAAGIDLPLSVNLSPRTLTSPGFADLLDALPRLASKGTLGLEVTETALMGRIGEVRETLLTLKAAGVVTWIDDFGIGHSSLAYLQSLPIHALKIDRSFVAALDCPPSQAIVRAILAMAEALGLETLAEGVETAEQARWLLDHGCRKAQGYLLGLPLEPEAFRLLYLTSGPAACRPEVRLNS
jgi:diguanylate cyclase (GGDEF)-like protein